MKIAIYSRKSKFTGVGDSIENQIEMCKDYIQRNFKNYDIVIYEDEGFSGGNLDRPEFKKLMNAIKTGTINKLICYRLDRISRNVSDFSSTLEILQEYKCDFISLKEQFDTSTPMGRAMIYIASVFAQLERETIAERVKDNMLEMAKNGFWTGGKIPLGFISKKVSTYDSDGKKRTKTLLIADENQKDYVKMLYEKYLELGSLHKLEVYCTRNNLKSHSGILYEKSSLKIILTNPIYVKANKEVIEYLKEKNWTIYGEYDNLHSLLTYNKTEQSKKHGKYVKVKKNPDESFAAISNIEGFIEPKLWLNVQKQFDKNRNKFPRLGKTHNALLVGKLRCGNCNNYMLVQHGKVNSNGEKTFYYMCSLKRKSHKALCDINNAKAKDIENLVIMSLKQLGNNKKEYLNSLINKASSKTIKTDYISEKEKINKEIKSLKNKIEKLLDIIVENDDKSSIAPIIDRMKEYKKRSNELNQRLIDLDSNYKQNKLEQINLELISELLNECSSIDVFPRDKQKLIIDNLIDNIYWYGDGKRGGKIKIKFVGSDNNGKEIDINLKLHNGSSSMCKVYKTATFKNIFNDIVNKADYSNLPENSIKEKIYKLRKINNLTLKEFSKLTNVPYSCICKYSLGYNASSKNLLKIINTFDLPKTYFNIKKD